MCLFLFVLLSLLSSVFIAGCGEEKNAAYFKQHPEAVFSSAMECANLSNSAALQNKTCAAIAEFEKPLCQQELSMNGRIVTPVGYIYNCNDPYYLIARPVIEAKMKAYLEGKPDPVVEYEKNHPAF